MSAKVQLVKDLVAMHPALEDEYECHVFNEGEVLAYVFFWDVVQEVVAACLAQESEGLDWQSVLDFLETQLVREVPSVRSVICTSFLLNLPHPGKPGHEIVDSLGPAMARKFQELRPLG